MTIGVPELSVLTVLLVTAIVVVWPAMRICGRLGLSPWLGVLAVVPMLNLVLLWFVALSPWPAAGARLEGRR